MIKHKFLLGISVVYLYFLRTTTILILSEEEEEEKGGCGGGSFYRHTRNQTKVGYLAFTQEAWVRFPVWER